MASGWIDEQHPSPLVLTGQPSWDGAPGGREPYVEQVASLLVDLEGGRVHPAHRALTCTIPTISALDLDGAIDSPCPPRRGSSRVRPTSRTCTSMRRPLLACSRSSAHHSIPTG